MPLKQCPPMKLTPLDKQALATLSYSEGFRVLQKMMEYLVQWATVQTLDVEPTDPDRSKNLDALQMNAYAQNNFCQSLFKQINWAKETASEDEAPKKQEDNVLARVGYVRP